MYIVKTIGSSRSALLRRAAQGNGGSEVGTHHGRSRPSIGIPCSKDSKIATCSNLSVPVEGFKRVASVEPPGWLARAVAVSPDPRLVQAPPLRTDGKLYYVSQHNVSEQGPKCGRAGRPVSDLVDRPI